MQGHGAYGAQLLQPPVQDSSVLAASRVATIQGVDGSISGPATQAPGQTASAMLASSAAGMYVQPQTYQAQLQHLQTYSGQLQAGLAHQAWRSSSLPAALPGCYPTLAPTTGPLDAGGAQTNHRPHLGEQAGSGSG